MKTTQKFLAILAVLLMTVSVIAVEANPVDDLTIEADTEITIPVESDEEEPDCQTNCDEPIKETDKKDV